MPAKIEGGNGICELGDNLEGVRQASVEKHFEFFAHHVLSGPKKRKGRLD